MILSNYNGGMILDQTTYDADYYEWEDGKKGKLLNITGNSYSWWMLKKEYSIDEIVEEIKLIKKKMHGRKRTELRMQINHAVRM